MLLFQRGSPVEGRSKLGILKPPSPLAADKNKNVFMEKAAAAAASTVERPADIRIIRIFLYNFAHACIPLSEYEANEYCQQVMPFKSSIFEQNPSRFGMFVWKHEVTF